MKKNVILLLASLFVAGMMLTACGSDEEVYPSENEEVKPSDDEDVKPSLNGITLADLIGSWSLKAEQYTTVYTFTQDELTMQTTWNINNHVEETKVNYSFQNGVLKYTEDEMTTETQPFMLYNKNVLVYKIPVEVREGVTGESVQFFYRDGSNVNANVEDIQGMWYMYHQGDEDDINSALKIDGNTFELVRVAWSMRYVGTFTYENGYMHCTTTACYSARSENSEGFGEGFIDPTTATSDVWYELDESAWLHEKTMDFPFIANGTEAYGNMVNVPGIFIKK